MKKKQNLLIFPLLLMGVFLVFASSCKKDDDDNVGKPVLTTTAVTNITQTAAKSGGNITSDGGVIVTARGVCWSTGQTPSISDNKTTDGTGVGHFQSNISGLSPNTTYYVRAYATNSNGTVYGSAISFKTQSISGNSFIDSRDGNIYQFATIGNQTWMAENLRYLPSVVGSSTGSETTPYYYVYGYNGTNVTEAKATSNYTTYGVLYNWQAAMAGYGSSSANPSGVKGVCPIGWHMPSDAEWTELTDFLGGTSVAGKLKESGTIHWSSPNTGATNQTGFTARPGGRRHNNGTFESIGVQGNWWTATGGYANTAWFRSMSNNSDNINRNHHYMDAGFSVRCVKN